MPRLPVVSGKEAVRVFIKAGWEISRQEGSHIILVKPESPVILTVPNHREVRRGTLRALIRQASMTVEEFQSLLKE